MLNSPSVFRSLLSFFIAFIFYHHAFGVSFEGHNIVASGPSLYAIESAKKTFKKGGNVADAAVAMALTLSVTTPSYAALGGGGFALIKQGATLISAIDFREVAPLTTSPDYFKDRSSQDGGTAVGVPGLPAGLWAIHKKFGKLPWKTLFTDAVELAENGFQISGEWARNTSSSQKRFDPNGIRYFFKKQASAFTPGEMLKQPQLARALRLFRDKGEVGFYSGEVATDIVRTVQKSGGAVTSADLKTYKVRWLEPLVTEFKGHKIFLMPPPSSAGVVIKTALALTQKMELEKYKFLSVDELHLMGEILAAAFQGRNLLADPDFYKNPIDFLTSETYFSKLAKDIHLNKTLARTPLTEGNAPHESETTHFSVLDAEGNAVAFTVTLNGLYGSGVVTEKFGIALNNEMDDFTTKPGTANQFGLIQGSANKVEPGKRPISSMSPTLVEKDGKVVMAIGSPGGPRIISSVFQVLYRSLSTGLTMDASIQAPRVHHQVVPNILYIDSQKISPEVLDLLRTRGHTVEESPVAKVFGVKKNANGILEGAFDSRGEGAAGGF